jgi:hypothetical protein
MGAHRYWRLFMPKSFNGSNVAMAEVEMATTPGGANVIGSATAAASTSFNSSSNPPAMLNDGTKTGSNWWACATGAFPCWTSFDTGSSVDINEIRLWARADSAQDQCPFSGTVQWSDDNINWTNYWSWFEPASSSYYPLGTLFTYVNPALAPATTWAYDEGGTAIVVDNKSLVARSLSSTAGSIMARRPITSALTYWEIALGSTLTGSCRIGVCTTGLTGLVLPGADLTACAYDSGGTVKINNATVATLVSYTASDNIGVAVRSDLALIWFRKNGGGWNNDVIANQDPANGIGGISLSTLTGGGYGIRPAFGGSTFAQATALFASTSWIYTAPTGAQSIDVRNSSAVSGGIAQRGSSFTTYKAADAVTPPTFLATSSFPAQRGAVLPGAWYGNQKIWTPAAPMTKISGQVQESGSPVAGRRVLLYDQATGALIGTTLSDGSGNYAVPALGHADVFAVFIDPPYDAMIFDNLVPL